MKHRPFAVIHAGATAAADIAILSITTAALVVTRANYVTAVATINGDPVAAGLPAGTVVAALPSVPTGKKGLFYQPATPVAAGVAPVGETLDSAEYTSGFDAPNKAFDQILSAAVYAAIAAELAP